MQLFQPLRMIQFGREGTKNNIPNRRVMIITQISYNHHMIILHVTS